MRRRSRPLSQWWRTPSDDADRRGPLKLGRAAYPVQPQLDAFLGRLRDRLGRTSCGALHERAGKRVAYRRMVSKQEAGGGGELPSRKVGRCRLYIRQKIEALLTSDDDT